MGNDYSIERPERVNNLLPHAHYDVREYVLDLEQAVINLNTHINSDPDLQEGRVQSLCEEGNRLRAIIEKLNNKQQHHGAEVNSVRNELRDLKERYKKLQETYDTYQQNNSHVLEEMGKETDRIRSEKEHLIAERDKLNEIIDSLKTKNQAYSVSENTTTDKIHKSSSPALEDHYKQLDAKYLDMQEELFAVQIKNYELKTQLEQVSNDNKRLRSKNNQLHDHAGNSTEQLKRTTT